MTGNPKLVEVVPLQPSNTSLSLDLRQLKKIILEQAMRNSASHVRLCEQRMRASAVALEEARVGRDIAAMELQNFMERIP